MLKPVKSDVGYLDNMIDQVDRLLLCILWTVIILKLFLLV